MFTNNISYSIESIVDLSSIAYEDSTSSKTWYFTLLICSFSSVCLSFARILKWGEKPVIASFYSVTFFKIFLLIFTTLVLQAIRMAAAIKSLLIFEVIHARADLSTGEVGEIFEMYYRGIEQGPEILTFYQAAFVASIFSIVLIYGTAFITIIIFSLRFYGLGQWYENIKDNFVLFIFPLVTNFSFYQKMEVKEQTDVMVECQNYTHQITIFQYSKKITRNLSLPELALTGREMEQTHQHIKNRFDI